MFRGRVRWAIPYTFVGADEERLALYVAPGTVGMRPRRFLVDYVEQLRSGTWDHEEHVWHSTHVLRLTPYGAAHSLNLFWSEEDWSFLGWYVNLEEPLRPSALGLDTFDHALDIVIDPSGSWQWKDEDQLAALTELGVFSPADAAAIRAEGERVLSRRNELIPTGWETWRPDPAWRTPELPDGWAEV